MQASLEQGVAWELDEACNLLVDTLILHHKELKAKERRLKEPYKKTSMVYGFDCI